MMANATGQTSTNALAQRAGYPASKPVLMKVTTAVIMNTIKMDISMEWTRRKRFFGNMVLLPGVKNWVCQVGLAIGRKVLLKLA